MLLRKQKELRSEKNSIDFSDRVKKMEFVRRWRPKCVYPHTGVCRKIKFTKRKEKKSKE